MNFIGHVDKLDIIVCVKCGNILSGMSNVLVLVRLDTTSTTGTIYDWSILTSFFDDEVYTLSDMWYSFVPIRVHTEAENVVYVAGNVKLLLQSSERNVIQTFEFDCLGCTDEEIFDTTSQSCQCVPCTMSVCMECSPVLCNHSQHLVSTTPDRCIVGTNNLFSKAQTKIYSVQCMPCLGTKYCLTGNNSEIGLCPTNRPYTTTLFSKTDQDCGCAENRSRPFSNLQKSTDPHVQLVTVGYPMFFAECFLCPNNTICNPYYDLTNNQVQCPDTTEYVHSQNTMYYDQIVTQTCMCVPGHYAYDTQLLDTLNTRTNAYLHLYTWDIQISKILVMLELTFFNWPTESYTLEDTCETVIKSWVRKSCGQINCFDAETYEQMTSTPVMVTEIITYYMNVQFVLLLDSDVCKLDINLLQEQLPGEHVVYMSCKIHSDHAQVSPADFFENKVYHVHIQSCRPCPVGYYCNLGEKQICPPHSTSIAMSETRSRCECLPGYHGEMCTGCEPGLLCYGGEVV